MLQHVKDFEDLVRTVVQLCNPDMQVWWWWVGGGGGGVGMVVVVVVG